MVLTWEDNLPVELNTDELYLPQFELKDTNTDRCIALYKTGRLLTNCIFKHAWIILEVLHIQNTSEMSGFFFPHWPLGIFQFNQNLKSSACDLQTREVARCSLAFMAYRALHNRNTEREAKIKEKLWKDAGCKQNSYRKGLQGIKMLVQQFS